MKITRRDALKLLAGSGVAAGVGGIHSLTAMAAARPHIAAITGPNPAVNAQQAIAALGGMGRFVSKGDVVVLKPNAGFGYDPKRGATTEPAVVRAVAKLCMNAGAKRVLVLDNPCHRADIALTVCGIKGAMKGLDDVFAYTVTGKKFFRKVAIPKGVGLKHQLVATDILEADKIINLPVAKSHGSAKVSFGMKNWMGVVYDRGFWHTDIDLNRAIADFASFMKPTLTVLDATRAMLTGGPGGPGTLAQLNTVVAGTDPVAMDAFGLTLGKYGGSGYTVADVPYIGMAEALGVGSSKLDRLTILRKEAT